MVWEDSEKYLLKDDTTKQFLEKIPDLSEIVVPDDYKDIWKESSYDVQVDKATRYGLTDEQRTKCFEGLVKRPYYLVNIAKSFDVKNIVEIGTAEGLQFYSFGKYASTVNGHVWSCDTRDVRNKNLINEYNHVTTFCPGTSAELSRSIPDGTLIDMFYIDADHRRGAVVKDVANLRKHQHDNTIWIFDDFDLRFGCYHDIMTLCKINKRFKIYRVGNAASGNPNHQVIMFGKF